jgi:hypothetical protein
MRWLFLILCLWGLTLLSGCGGGGGSPSSEQASEVGASAIPKQIGIVIEFDKFFLRQARASAQAVRRSVSRSLFPNLQAFRLEISAPGQDTQSLTFNGSSTSANIKLAVGFVYTIRVIALGLNNSIIAQGEASLDLLEPPAEGFKPKISIKLEIANPTDIRATVWPASGNLLSGQNLYFFLNQSGKIHYSINGNPFELLENLPSTAGQIQGPENGRAVPILGEVGGEIEVRFMGEDLEGNLSEVKLSRFSLIQITQFMPLEVSEVRSTVVSGGDFTVAQIIPVHRVPPEENCVASTPDDLNGGFIIVASDPCQLCPQDFASQSTSEGLFCAIPCPNPDISRDPVTRQCSLNLTDE